MAEPDPALTRLAELLGCEPEDAVERAWYRIHYLMDLPLCRRQLPDGHVPGNTEQALEAWVRVAGEQSAEIRRLRAALAVLAGTQEDGR